MMFREVQQSNTPSTNILKKVIIAGEDNPVLAVGKGDDLTVICGLSQSIINMLNSHIETVDVTRATEAKVNFKAIQANENGAVFKLKGERSALFMGDVQDDSHHHAKAGSSNNMTIRRVTLISILMWYSLAIMAQGMQRARKEKNI